MDTVKTVCIVVAGVAGLVILWNRFAPTATTPAK